MAALKGNLMKKLILLGLGLTLSHTALGADELTTQTKILTLQEIQEIQGRPRIIAQFPKPFNKDTYTRALLRHKGKLIAELSTPEGICHLTYGKKINGKREVIKRVCGIKPQDRGIFN